MFVPLVRYATRALAVAATVATISAQSPPILYPASDAARDIDGALSAARKDGKHVLLDFGADWCPDCRVLGALFENAAVAPVLESNFHVVRIDVGRRDKNGDLADKYHATSGDWIPAVVILGPDGSTIAVTNDIVRLTRRTTTDELVKLLKEWAPKKREQSLGSFVDRGVRVALSLDRDRSGGLWLAGVFTPTVEATHLYSTALPADGIQGLGRPTRITIAAGSSIKVLGPAVADRPVVADRIEGLGLTLPIYPPGPLTLRLPVSVTSSSPAGAVKADVMVSYMACGPRGCLAPVTDRRVSVLIR